MRLVALQTAIVHGVLLAGGICLAQQTVTVKGVTYVEAELIKEYPQSVYISHAAGKDFVNKADLSAGERLAAFIRENNIKTLNVAGSRGSKEPGVAAFVKRTLETAFYPRAEAMVLRG